MIQKKELEREIEKKIKIRFLEIFQTLEVQETRVLDLELLIKSKKIDKESKIMTKNLENSVIQYKSQIQDYQNEKIKILNDNMHISELKRQQENKIEDLTRKNME